MDDKRLETVSYLVYESSQTRSERLIHRLLVALVITVGLLFVTNALWLYAWSQHGKVDTNVENSNYIGENGTIHNEN